jgi:hypothetical protein
MTRVFVALALVLACAAAGLTQDEKAFEPENLSVFYSLGASGQAIELERQIPSEALKANKLLLAVPGEKSPVRLSAGSKIQFVVRVTEDFDKATATMQLMRFEARDGMRQLLVKKPTKNNLILETGLKLNAEKYGSSSLKLTPAEQLVPGEYCISRTTIQQGFCFGVDPAANQ